MTTFTTDTQLLRAKSANVLATAERLRSEVATMHAGLQELQGAWTGGASANFHQLVAQWRAAQERMEESLTGISQALGTASNHYEEAERANLGLFAF